MLLIDARIQRNPASSYLLLSICLLGCSLPALAQSTQTTAATEETAMTMQAKGTFQVKMAPQEQEEHATGDTLARMALDKQYIGDLEATGKGQMLTAMTQTKGSAGYVAIERVEGSLLGRQGSFILQHSGTMSSGAQQLSLSVVPDSGSGQLTGLSGTMEIIITNGEHAYVFDYRLAP